MKINSIFKGLAVIAVMLLVGFGFMHTAYAASQSTQHTVTASVPSQLSISADTSNVTLIFDDFVSGTETDAEPMVYTVKGNNVQKTTGVVTAKLDGLFTDIDLQAEFGSYSKIGGNASLEANGGGGFTNVLAASAVPIADKVIDGGTGKNLNGKLTVNYKAIATADLEAGDQVKTLTVSVIDA